MANVVSRGSVLVVKRPGNQPLSSTANLKSAQLGWQVKTRNERDVPLVPMLHNVLRHRVGQRRSGPVFVQRRCFDSHQPPLASRSRKSLEQEVVKRLLAHEKLHEQPPSRADRNDIARTVWRDLGALKEDWIRKDFIQLTKAIGLGEITAPKTLRHTFATILQETDVDPLVRNELMGHAPMGTGLSGSGLGKIDLAYPTPLGRFAISQYRSGRRVGSSFRKPTTIGLIHLAQKTKPGSSR